jgi:hypothetical protein
MGPVLFTVVGMVVIVGGGLLVFRNVFDDQGSKAQRVQDEAAELLDPTTPSTTTTPGAAPTAPPGRKVVGVGPWYVTVPNAAVPELRRLRTSSGSTIPVGQWVVDHDGWVEVVRLYDLTDSYSDAQDLVRAWALDPDPTDPETMTLTEDVEGGPVTVPGIAKATTWWTVGGTGPLPGIEPTGDDSGLRGRAAFVALDENFLLQVMVVGSTEVAPHEGDLAQVLASVGTR